MNAIVDGSEIDGANPGDPFVIELGQLNFDNSGRLIEEVVPDPIQVDWLGADPGQISFDFGDAIADGGTGTSGSSQWNRVTESVANFVGQNGYGTGELDGTTAPLSTARSMTTAYSIESFTESPLMASGQTDRVSPASLDPPSKWAGPKPAISASRRSWMRRP